jgi:hypothetical protein
MSEEPWARVSLRIASDALTIEEIDTLVGLRNALTPGPYWAADLIEDSSVSLDEQLRMAKDVLTDKAAVLESLSDAQIVLCIGWTPRNPQDGVVLDLEMIGLLSRIRCFITLDTYLD